MAQPATQQQVSYTISWKNLNLLSPKQNKPLLTGIYGSASSGDFLSIMGPSGAGKSSLLSIITARLRKDNTPLTISGQLLLNGLPYSLNQMSKISAYVQQDDLLFGTLTVRQTFQFQARLKLWKLSFQQQNQRVEQIIKKLNLLQCGETLIGNNQFKKSISGGQKKRVSIGMELISNPQILIFDEPTSGLDSHNALIIIRLLSKLAKEQRKLIITTIHQPSTLIFRAMDRLYLLKSGRCIYDGPANQMVGYMQELGIKINYRMNPADFFMLEISAMKEQQGHCSLLNSENYEMRMKKLRDDNVDSSCLEQFQIITYEDLAPFSYQFKPLWVRAFKNFYRLPSNQLNKLVTAIMLPLLLGILYFKIADEPPADFQQSYLFNLIAFWFMGLYFIFSMNVYDTVMIFPIQKELVFRETACNLYSISSYYISRLLAEILFGCLIPALICSIVLYLTAAMDLSSTHFLLFIGLYLILAFQGYLFGMFFGVLCKDQQSAINLLPMVMIPILIFGGLAVNINDIPVYIRWFQYLSPLRHSFLILFQDQMSSSKFQQYAYLNLAETYGVGGDVTISYICLMALFATYFILSLVLLYLLKKKL